jgi:hypothetical protein
MLGVQYRVFFTTRVELSQWLKASRGYDPVDRREWFDPDFEEWIKAEPRKPYKLLTISKSVFDEKDDLVIYTPQQWHDEWVLMSESQAPQADPDPPPITDDDVPF